MAADQLIRKHADFVASVTEQLQRKAAGISDADADDVYMLASLVHFHDGGMGQIAWNDVQAAQYKNRYLRKGRDALLKVEASASEGYNQHHHTSEFDGGIIPGVMGNHDHRDNAHGGFAFAVFHPATKVPHAVWEG